MLGIYKLLLFRKIIQYENIYLKIFKNEKIRKKTRKKWKNTKKTVIFDKKIFKSSIKSKNNDKQH